MEEDIFEPQQAQAPAPAAQEGSFLDRPGMRSAILQASLAMLQPRPAGTSVLQQLGNAVGQGGEAFQRANKMRLAEDENTRRQKNTDSQIAKRDGGGSGKSGGLTTSQRLSQQKAQRSQFEKWVKDESKRMVGDGSVYQDENQAREALLADPELKNKYRQYNDLVDAATTPTRTVTSAQVMKELAPHMAEWKARMARGDAVAVAEYKRVRQMVADPEALDSYMGYLVEENE